MSWADQVPDDSNPWDFYFLPKNKDEEEALRQAQREGTFPPPAVIQQAVAQLRDKVQNTDRLSIGSAMCSCVNEENHQFIPCRYFRSNRGCNLGRCCPKCHLCVWRLDRNNRQTKELRAIKLLLWRVANQRIPCMAGIRLDGMILAKSKVTFWLAATQAPDLPSIPSKEYLRRHFYRLSFPKANSERAHSTFNTGSIEHFNSKRPRVAGLSRFAAEFLPSCSEQRMKEVMSVHRLGQCFLHVVVRVNSEQWTMLVQIENEAMSFGDKEVGRSVIRGLLYTYLGYYWTSAVQRMSMATGSARHLVHHYSDPLLEAGFDMLRSKSLFDARWRPSTFQQSNQNSQELVAHKLVEEYEQKAGHMKERKHEEHSKHDSVDCEASLEEALIHSLEYTATSCEKAGLLDVAEACTAASIAHRKEKERTLPEQVYECLPTGLWYDKCCEDMTRRHFDLSKSLVDTMPYPWARPVPFTPPIEWFSRGCLACKRSTFESRAFCHLVCECALRVEMCPECFPSDKNPHRCECDWVCKCVKSAAVIFGFPESDLTETLSILNCFLSFDELDKGGTRLRGCVDARFLFPFPTCVDIQVHETTGMEDDGNLVLQHVRSTGYPFSLVFFVLFDAGTCMIREDDVNMIKRISDMIKPAAADELMTLSVVVNATSLDEEGFLTAKSRGESLEDSLRKHLDDNTSIIKVSFLQKAEDPLDHDGVLVEDFGDNKPNMATLLHGLMGFHTVDGTGSPQFNLMHSSILDPILDDTDRQRCGNSSLMCAADAYFPELVWPSVPNAALPLFSSNYGYVSRTHPGLEAQENAADNSQASTNDGRTNTRASDAVDNQNRGWADLYTQGSETCKCSDPLKFRSKPCDRFLRRKGCSFGRYCNFLSLLREDAKSTHKKQALQPSASTVFERG